MPEVATAHDSILFSTNGSLHLVADLSVCWMAKAARWGHRGGQRIADDASSSFAKQFETLAHNTEINCCCNIRFLVFKLLYAQLRLNSRLLCSG